MKVIQESSFGNHKINGIFKEHSLLMLFQF